MYWTNHVGTSWLNCVKLLYRRIWLIINHCIFQEVLFSGGQENFHCCIHCLYVLRSGWLICFQNTQTILHRSIYNHADLNLQNTASPRPQWCILPYFYCLTFFFPHTSATEFEMFCASSLASQPTGLDGGITKQFRFIIRACLSQFVVHMRLSRVACIGCGRWWIWGALAVWQHVGWRSQVMKFAADSERLLLCFTVETVLWLSL